jgi:sugar lactone lactonase YvrE
MSLRLRIPIACVAALGLTVGLLATAPAATADAGVFPTVISLPDGFQPEGIAVGVLPVAFFGSRADGDIFRVNLVSGRGSVFSQGPGTGSFGMKVDLGGRLFVGGGPSGTGRVVNAFTGDILASYSVATGTTFVNDVAITPQAAYFTDSFRPFLYKVPLGRHGELPDQSAVTSIPLTGDFVEQPTGFNANGIVRTPDGRALLVIQSGTGLLFRVDPATGVATTVDLGGQLLTAGDGLAIRGRTLFAVQNQLNRVAVVNLNNAGTAGSVTEFLTDPGLDIPTGAGLFGDRVYVVNARFSTPPTPTTPYTAVAIRR